jgi:N-acetyl-anhydromuramyl-L-alanine amidase AmpD
MFSSLAWVLASFGIILFTIGGAEWLRSYRQNASLPALREQAQALLGILGMALISMAFAPLLPKAWPTLETAAPQTALTRPLGSRAALQLGLAGRRLLPDTAGPRIADIAWLNTTQAGRPVIYKPIGLFQSPATHSFRREGLEIYFWHRHELPQVLARPFRPRMLVLHSTEGEHEGSAYAIFNRNTRQQYLGGVWTHFAVDPAGQIFQYGPLNRVSKGQAGVDDIAVGIEIVGHASRYDRQGQRINRGSIAQRWEQGDTRQLKAVADLVKTLQSHFGIPRERIYAHEDVAQVRDRQEQEPDFEWLRHHIRDKVYLGLVPDLGEGRKPTVNYGFLTPYDRTDPGRDIMAILKP